MEEPLSFWDDRTTLEEDDVPPRPKASPRAPSRPSNPPRSSVSSNPGGDSLGPRRPSSRRPNSLSLRSGSSRPTSAFRPGNILQGKYRIDKLISEGGMGQVYLATHLPLDRKVVVKVLRQDRRDGNSEQRFLLEATACACIDSQHTVQVMDYDKSEDDEAYYIAEYIRGVSLTELLRTQPRLDAQRALDLGIQIARGLEAIHRKSFVHRDLKPDNIMITEDPDSGKELVKIIDFGLVKMTGDRDPASVDLLDLTRSGMMLGSPKYMAPEQVRGHPVDFRTDIYSLGVVLFQLLTGRPPFLGTGSFEIMNQHLSATAPPLDSVNPTLPRPIVLDTIVGRCLQKHPAHRVPSAESLREELEWAQTLLVQDATDGGHPAAQDLSDSFGEDARFPVDIEIGDAPTPKKDHPSKTSQRRTASPKPLRRRVTRGAVVLGLILAGCAALSYLNTLGVLP